MITTQTERNPGRFLPAHYLRAGTDPGEIKVDRENKILRGCVIAQLGVFKSGRGQFDDASLREIVSIINSKPKGLKARFTHPGLFDDGLGSFLGRWKNAWISEAKRERGETVPAVRANLHFDRTALDVPPKSKGNGRPLADYVMALAESDSAAFGCSIAIPLDSLKEISKDSKGAPLMDSKGKRLPPIWRMTNLNACDLVDTGDATDGLLSIDGGNLRCGEMRSSTSSGQTLEATTRKRGIAVKVANVEGFLMP